MCALSLCIYTITTLNDKFNVFIGISYMDPKDLREYEGPDTDNVDNGDEK